MYILIPCVLCGHLLLFYSSSRSGVHSPKKNLKHENMTVMLGASDFSFTSVFKTSDIVFYLMKNSVKTNSNVTDVNTIYNNDHCL